MVLRAVTATKPFLVTGEMRLDCDGYQTRLIHSSNGRCADTITKAEVKNMSVYGFMVEKNG